MHNQRTLTLSRIVLRTCLALLVGFLLLPGRAQALVFAPLPANLPVAIPAPGAGNNPFGESAIIVSGIQTSISDVKVGVWVTYPTIGDLAITLTAPTGVTVILADQEGMLDTGNNNGGGCGLPCGGGGGGGGGAIGGSGSYGFGPAVAPGGEVGFDDAAATSIDQFRGQQAISTIPSAVYRPSTQTGWLPNNATNMLAKYIGYADLEVNGTWLLDVFNYDQFFGGFNGGTGTGTQTGNINQWTLEIDEVGVHVWTGAVSTNWSLTNNWSNGAPTPREHKVVLDFPASAGQFTTVNDIAGLTLGSVTFDGNYTISTTVAAGCTATGNALFLNLGGNTTWSIPLVLTYPADGLKAPNGSTFQATGITVEVNSGTLTMSGVISGGAAPGGATRGPATIDVEGPGTLVLSGANTYVGVTNVDSGILDAQNANAVSGSLTNVNSGATLQLGIPGAATPFAGFAEALTLSSVGVGAVGALELVSTGTVTVTSPITFTSQDAAVGAVAGGILNLNGALTGGGLTFEGLGTLNINSALPGANLITNGGTINLLSVNAVPILGLNNGGSINATGGILTVEQAVYSSAGSATNNLTGALKLSGATTFNVGHGSASPDLLITASSLSGPGSVNQTGSGNLELDCTAVGAPAVAYAVSQGTLSGTAKLGTLNVLNGAVLQPGLTTGVGAGTGAMSTTGAAVLNGGSVYVAQLFGATPATLTVGGKLSVSGATANGAGGAYISPVGDFSGAGSYTVINYTVGNFIPSAFVNRPFPASSGITYGTTTGPANSITLDLDGSTVSLVNTSYTLSKGAGNVPIAVTWVGATGSADLIAVPGTAILAQDYNQPTPTPLLASAGTTFTLPIVQNYIAEGNTTFDLLLVPMGGTTATRNSSTANVTIIDNQNSGYQQKHCGMGSGFTVFFLFAIGLALRALYLRRR